MSAQGTGATQQNTASLQAVAAALAAVTASMTALTNVVRASTQAAQAARGAGGAGGAGGGAGGGGAGGAANPANGPVVAQFNEQRLSDAIMESRRGVAGGITGAAAVYARAAGEEFAGPVGGAIAELAVDNFVTRGAINAAGSMAGAVANDMFRFGSSGLSPGASAYSAFGRVAAEIPFAGQAFQQTETAFVNARDRSTGLMAPGASVGAVYSDEQVLQSQVFFSRQEGRVEAARIQQERVSTANKRQLENAAAESYGFEANVLLSAKRVAFDAVLANLEVGGPLNPYSFVASIGVGTFTAGSELLRLTGLRS